VFLLCFFQTGAQTWWEKHKPHVPIWEYPRVKEMNLLDREYSRSIHFGFGLGLNAFDFSRIQNSNNTVFIPGQGNAILHADLIHLKPGFSINAVTDYRLMTNFNVRFLPGIFFGQRQLDFYRNDTKGLVKSMTIASNYLEFPIVFKYSADRYTNFRPYILTGLNTRVNLSNTINMDSERYIGLKKFEPFVEFGLGFDYYFDYFRMGTEFKVSSGLVNCLNNTEAFGYEYYRKSLKSIYSNTISFTISFEL
jgi:hypothetical protein